MMDNKVGEFDCCFKAPAFLKWSFLLGVFWIALGVAYIPVNKVYQQGIITLLFFPTIFLLLINYKTVCKFISFNKVFFCILIALFFYSAINSVFLGNYQSAKHVLYVLFFCLSGFIFVLLDFNEKLKSNFLLLILAAVTLIAFASIYNFFYVEGYNFNERMWGVIGVNHPILGSYYIGVFLLVCFFMIVNNSKLYMLPFLIVMSAYIVFAQSRGAYLAIFSAPMLYGIFFLRKNKCFRWFLFFILSCAVLLAYFFFEQIMLRGDSNRFEIMSLAIEVGIENFWFGHGVGYDFSPHALHSTEVFQHTHNLLTNIFIELGIFGLLFFTFFWLYCFYYCYINRDMSLARFNMLLITYSSIAFQFDAASFIAQPRLEWFLVWVPVSITFSVMAYNFLNKSNSSGI